MSIFSIFRKEQEPKEDRIPTLMIGSIMTGVPIQITVGGSLSGAGSQDLYFCTQLLKEMGKKNSIKKPPIWGKGTTVFTKSQVISHMKQYPSDLVKNYLPI